MEEQVSSNQGDAELKMSKHVVAVNWSQRKKNLETSDNLKFSSDNL